MTITARLENSLLVLALPSPKMRLMTVVCKSNVDAIREICRIPSLTTAFPFHVRRTEIALSKVRLMCYVVLLCVLTAQANELLRNPSDFYATTPLVYIIYCVEQISVKVTLLMSIVWTVRNRRLLKEMVQLLAQVEQSLLEHGLFWTVPVNYTLDAVVFVYLLCVLAHHSTLRVNNMCTYSKLMTYYTTMALLYIVSMQFSRIVLLICTGFRTVLSCLSSSNGSKSKYHMIKQTEKMIINYHKLYNVSRLLNKIYSPQILLLIFSSFLISTGNIYFLYHSVSMEEEFRENILRLSWLVFYSAISLIIIWPCTVIDKQAKEFNTLLYQLMIDDKSNEIINNKKLRLHIAMKREVIFTAYGFFNLDYTLLHSMIAAATTYLVILIQFGEPMASGSAPTAPADYSNLFINTTDSRQIVTNES